MRSWLAKMEADGPDPAPTIDLRQLFLERHQERCAHLRDRIAARMDA
jgi:hypothetical protein